MTLLHTRFESGLQWTAGAMSAGSIIGLSGCNDMTNRINFIGQDFHQNALITFTSDVDNWITQAIFSGTNCVNRQIDVIYNDDKNPVSVKVSGTQIGSTITYIFWYQNNGSLATSSGSIVSGTCVIT